MDFKIFFINKISAFIEWALAHVSQI